MLIEIYDGNERLYVGHVEADHVPRVGETLTLDDKIEYIPDNVSKVLVHEVTHFLNSGTLIPLIKCSIRLAPSERLDMLKEEYWIDS